MHFQVRESLLPLNSIIILQGVPNNLMCFLNGPLKRIKNQIIPLVPNNPRKIIPQEELAKLNCISALCKGLSKRHCTIKKDLWGPRLPLLAKNCHTMLATYRHPCWTSGQLKNLCSNGSTDCRPEWGQLLSISAEIFPRHSFTVTAL